jgi:hypothetical protein
MEFTIILIILKNIKILMMVKYILYIIKNILRKIEYNKNGIDFQIFLMNENAFIYNVIYINNLGQIIIIY